MDPSEEFPFNVGQIVESKSNMKGFRGAWFRSKIKYIQIRRGEVWCAMQYADFPDEKVNFMKAYQQEHAGKKKRVLMLRPSYPLICMGMNNELINETPGAVVVVNGNWLVGDLVDWFSDGCFWAAKITAVISNDLVQVELPSAPLGEGGVYEAAVKDIRPCLDWSIENRWSVPNSKSLQNSNKQHPFVDHVIPVKEEVEENGHFFIAKQEPMWVIKQPTQDAAINQDDKSFKNKQLFGASDMQRIKAPNKLRHANAVSQEIPPTALAANIPDVHLSFQTSDKLQQTAKDVNVHSATSSKQHKVNIVAPLDTLNRSVQEIHALIGEGKYVDTEDRRITSSIMALEELIGRVSWLRGVVEFGLKGWSQERKRTKWMVYNKNEDLQTCGTEDYVKPNHES